jgi:hypothetical protein
MVSRVKRDTINFNGKMVGILLSRHVNGQSNGLTPVFPGLNHGPAFASIEPCKKRLAIPIGRNYYFLTSGK